MWTLFSQFNIIMNIIFKNINKIKVISIKYLMQYDSIIIEVKIKKWKILIIKKFYINSMRYIR